MSNIIEQSNFDEIFDEKLTAGSISACLVTKLSKHRVSRSLVTDYFSEGSINERGQFAAFQTSRDAVIFEEYYGVYYLTYHREFFWSDELFEDDCSTAECFKQCIATLNAHPEAANHNEALFYTLESYANSTKQPTSLVS